MEAPTAHTSSQDEKEYIFPDSLFKYNNDKEFEGYIEQSNREILVIQRYLFDGYSPDCREMGSTFTFCCE